MVTYGRDREGDMSFGFEITPFIVLERKVVIITLKLYSQVFYSTNKPCLVSRKQFDQHLPHEKQQTT